MVGAVAREKLTEMRCFSQIGVIVIGGGTKNQSKIKCFRMVSAQQSPAR